MRVSDLLMNNDYLTHLNSIKNKVNDLQTQISTGNNINKPSDSPVGTANLMSWNTELSQVSTYSSNINSGLGFLQDTTNTMQNIQSEVSNVMSDLTSLNNVANTGNMSSYADQINQALDTMVNLANSKSDGKYMFGGTDFSAAPFSLAGDGSSVQIQPNDISGVQKIRISQGTQQKINMTGSEVFGTIVSLNGSLDSGSAAGSTVSQNTTIYDTSGNPYTLSTTFTKTATNTYNMNYDIKDSGNTSIFSSAPAAKTVVFDPATGNIQSIDGQTPSSIHIKDSSKNLDFSLNPIGVSEKSGTSSLNFSANQTTDIFNTLIQIRDNLKNGVQPTDSQIQAVTDFNNRMLNNITNAGNIINQLTDSQDLLTNRQTQLNTTIANTQGLDLAKAIVDLQSQNNTLQMTYKLASTISNDTLLNYL